MALRWYAARTKPMAEYAAANSLERAGFETFFPCAETPHPRRGRKDAPLFPGYLFLRYDLEGQGWRPLRRVPYVAGLVAFEGVVPPMPDEVIAELAQRVETINSRGGLWRRFRPGDRVRVALGPRESLAEVVAGAESPRARVRVLLDFVGRLVHAEVPWRDVRPVATSEDTWPMNSRSPRRTRGGGRWIRGYGPRAVTC